MPAADTIMTSAQPRVALWLCALAVAALGVVSWGQSMVGQARLDDAYTAEQLTRALGPAYRAADERDLRAQVRRLALQSDLGLSFLAVRDDAGRVLASIGAFETLRVPGLPAVQRNRIRQQLYRLSSRRHTISLRGAVGPAGSVEFARFRSLTGEVESTALITLRRLGYSLLGVALLMAGYALLTRRRAQAGLGDAQLRERVVADPVLAPPPDHAGEALDGRLLNLLSAAGIGVVHAGEEGRVLALNAVAAGRTGWAERHAIGKPLAAVLQTRPAAALAPLPTGREDPPGWCHLRDRSGDDHAVVIHTVAAPRGLRPGEVHLFWTVDTLADALTRRQALLQRWHDALSCLPMAALIVSADGRIEAGFGRATAMLGYADGQWSALTLAKLFPVPFVQQPELSLDAFSGDVDNPPLVRAWRRDARSLSVTLRTFALPGAAGGWLAVLDEPQSVHAARAAALRERRWRDWGADQSLVIDARTLAILEIGESARETLGSVGGPGAPTSLLALAPTLDRATLQAWLRALREGQVPVVRYDTVHRGCDGKTIPVSARLQYCDAAGQPVFLLTAMQRDPAPPDQASTPP